MKEEKTFLLEAQVEEKASLNHQLQNEIQVVRAAQPPTRPKTARVVAVTCPLTFPRHSPGWQRGCLMPVSWSRCLWRGHSRPRGGRRLATVMQLKLGLGPALPFVSPTGSG